ncbi:sodium-dependent glucose transporter 1B-like [Ptychodera flava]|uniref:sodium-dependent glucose transporter 1B-like n=1 Tax=Ptychodera flava TaxID=63121 RepID=UPI00396A0296
MLKPMSLRTQKSRRTVTRGIDERNSWANTSRSSISSPVHISTNHGCLSLWRVGFLVGSVVVGFCLDRFDNHLLLALGILGLGVFNALIPWCPLFGVLILNFVVWGCLRGFIDTGGNVVCVNLWGKESGPYMQAVHFTFAVGATIAPLIAGPFLMPQEEGVISAVNESSTISPTKFSALFTPSFQPSDTRSYSFIQSNFTSFVQTATDPMNGTFFMTENTDLYEKAPSLKIWIPYTILSVFNVVASLPFFCLYFVEGRKIYASKKSSGSAAPRDHEYPEKKDKHFEFILLALLGAFIFAYLGHETIYGNFLYTFAVSSDLGFTPETASYLNAAYWGSFAAFRFFAIFIALKVTPRTLLTVDVIGMCISSTTLAIFGNHVAEVLWVATVLLGASIASTVPSCISWAERHIKRTSKAMTVINSSAACVDIAIPWTIGLLFSAFGSQILMYVMLTISFSTATVYFCMQFYASRHSSRYGVRLPTEDTTEVNGV